MDNMNYMDLTLEQLKAIIGGKADLYAPQPALLEAWIRDSKRRGMNLEETIAEWNSDRLCSAEWLRKGEAMIRQLWNKVK